MIKVIIFSAVCLSVSIQFGNAHAAAGKVSTGRTTNQVEQDATRDFRSNIPMLMPMVDRVVAVEVNNWSQIQEKYYVGSAYMAWAQFSRFSIYNTATLGRYLHANEFIKSIKGKKFYINKLARSAIQRHTFGQSVALIAKKGSCYWIRLSKQIKSIVRSDNPDLLADIAACAPLTFTPLEMLRNLGYATETDRVQLAKRGRDDVKKPSPPPVKEVPKSGPAPPAGSGSSGTAFFVSISGHLVTNKHVVRDCKNVTVGDDANRQVGANVLETDRRNDLALLKISSTTKASAETKSLIRKLGLSVAPLSSSCLLRSEDVELGERILVAGFPYGELFSNTIKVTGGMVSAIRGIGDDSGQFQMDAAVQPGNSGGPIYDANGNIVGVVVAQLNKMKVAQTTGSMPENVNFGIKASTVRQFFTSSGLPTKWSSRSISMTTRELARIAKNQTVMVVCHQ